MGYRSQVYLKTTTEGWLVLKRFNDIIIEEVDKPLFSAIVNKTPAGFYRITFEDIKWYDSYAQIRNFNEAIKMFDTQDIPYSFIRLGEDTGDIEHNCNWTDDIPDEISSFEPVVDINDENWGEYESLDEDAD